MGHPSQPLSAYSQKNTIQMITHHLNIQKCFSKENMINSFKTYPLIWEHHTNRPALINTLQQITCYLKDSIVHDLKARPLTSANYE